MTDLAVILADLNDRYRGRALDTTGCFEAEIRAVCAERGLRVGEVRFRNGDRGVVVDVQLVPEPGEVFVTIVKVPA